MTKEGNTLVSRYDAEGLRAEIEENEKLTKFIFHKENVLVETDKDFNAISRFTRGYEVVAADIAELGGASDSGEEPNVNRYYYTVDEHGSTILITDKYKNIRNEYYYDAFGNVLESKEQVHNRITYAGQQFDGVTGQYYLRARFYNPVIGRFTQEDVYRGDGLNLYAYCDNNPIVYYDPSGFALCPENKQRIYNEYKDLRDKGYSSKQAYDYMKYKKANETSLGLQAPKGNEKIRSSGKYHTFHEFELKSDYHYASDSVQFRQANKSFINKLNSNTEFRKDMFRRNPELKTWLDSNPNLSNSPAGFTWHHFEETGVLKLVDRSDHSTNFSIYHPNGNGGRDIWGGGKLGRKGKLDKNGNVKK